MQMESVCSRRAAKRAALYVLGMAEGKGRSQQGGCHLLSVSFGLSLARGWAFALLFINVRQCMVPLMIPCSAPHIAE